MKKTIAVIMAIALFASASTALAGKPVFNNTTIAGGTSHTVKLNVDGTVWALGTNENYQLGREDTGLSYSRFVQVPGLSDIVSIAASYFVSAALSGDGEVYIWGDGVYSEPQKVPGLSNIVSITTGQAILLAVGKDSSVWQMTPGEKAAKVEGLPAIMSVSVGNGHCLALARNGEVWAWGENMSGQLGDGTQVKRDKPVKVGGLMNIIGISAGHTHSLAVCYDGRVFAWGSNTYGELGTGDTEPSLKPAEVLNITGAVKVAAGSGASMALTSDGKIYTWGYGGYGQLGVKNAPERQMSPVAVVCEETPVDIQAGMEHNFYITGRGSIYGWGRNHNGQLGGTGSGNLDVPTKNFSDSIAPAEGGFNPLTGMNVWASDEARELYGKGLIPTTLLNRYQDNITRGELAHLLVQVYEAVKKTSIESDRASKFIDIKDHMYESDIIKANILGLVDGISATTFAPDALVERQAAAKMICSFVVKMQNIKLPTEYNAVESYNDWNLIAGWARQFVSFAYTKNFIKGTSASQFSPTSNLTREQALVIVARLANNYKWK